MRNPLELLDDMGILFRTALQGDRANLWTAMPGIVSVFNAAEQTATVQVAIQGLQTAVDGTQTWVNIPALIHCPVIFPSGGGFTLTFPIASGDECLVIFASKCIDNWWASGAVSTQAEFRSHDISDGFVLPGPRSKPNALPAISPTSVQLRNDEGSSFVEINEAGTVNVVAPDVTVEAMEATVTAPIITLMGNVTIAGTLTVAGLVEAADLATPLVQSYNLHLHGNVKFGTDRTGVPSPGT